MRFAPDNRVDNPEAWREWRARLMELRRSLEAHLEQADVLAARAERAMSSAPAPTSSDDGRDGEAGCGRAEAEGVAATEGSSVAVQWSPAVQRALEHLATQYERAVSLAELARVAGCSREHLSRAVRRETGATVHAHLMRLRLARAARDVGAGDKIEAVMLGVGYRGKRNFYRQFKARFGMTPGRWRAEQLRRGGREVLRQPRG
jgi:AraC-like DNA-binding protein